MSEFTPEQQNPKPLAPLEYDQNGLIKMPDWSQSSGEAPKGPELIAPAEIEQHVPERATDGTITVARHGENGQPDYWDGGWQIVTAYHNSQTGRVVKYDVAKTLPNGNILTRDSILPEEVLPRIVEKSETLELEAIPESTVEAMGEDALRAAPVELHARNFHAERVSTPPARTIGEINQQLEALTAEKQPSVGEQIQAIQTEFSQLVNGLEPDEVQKLWRYGSAQGQYEEADTYNRLPQLFKQNGVAARYRELMQKQSQILAEERNN